MWWINGGYYKKYMVVKSSVLCGCTYFSVFENCIQTARAYWSKTPIELFCSTFLLHKTIQYQPEQYFHILHISNNFEHFLGLTVPHGSRNYSCVRLATAEISGFFSFTCSFPHKGKLRRWRRSSYRIILFTPKQFFMHEQNISTWRLHPAVNIEPQ